MKKLLVLVAAMFAFGAAQADQTQPQNLADNTQMAADASATATPAADADKKEHKEDHKDKKADEHTTTPAPTEGAAK